MGSEKQISRRAGDNFEIMRMTVLSEKRTEFSQAIASLSELIRMEKGLRLCDFCRSIEDDGDFNSWRM